MLAVGAAGHSCGVVETAAHADEGRRAAAQGEEGVAGVPRLVAVAEMEVAAVVPAPPGAEVAAVVPRCT